MLFLDSSLLILIYTISIKFINLIGYRSIMSETQAVKIVDEIMTNADVDNSGEIEYNGLKKKKLTYYFP